MIAQKHTPPNDEEACAALLGWCFLHEALLPVVPCRFALNLIVVALMLGKK